MTDKKKRKKPRIKALARKKPAKVEPPDKEFDEAQYYNDERADIGGVDIDVLRK